MGAMNIVDLACSHPLLGERSHSASFAFKDA
jgi:hypothetical protein